MAALVPIVRQNLDLTGADLGASGECIPWDKQMLLLMFPVHHSPGQVCLQECHSGPSTTPLSPTCAGITTVVGAIGSRVIIGECCHAGTVFMRQLGAHSLDMEHGTA